MNSFKYILFFSFFIFSFFSTSAQTLEQGIALYNSGKYNEAIQALDLVLKKSPKNTSAHFYCGASHFKLNHWNTAEKYLKTAVTGKNNEAFMLLGDLYFQTYYFQEASENFQKYIATIKNNPDLLNQIQKKLEKAELGEKMLRRVEDVIIIDSVVVDKSNFLSAYKLSKPTGDLSFYADFFHSKKSVTDQQAVVYETERKDRIVYAQKGVDGSLDLFSQDKLLDGYGSEKLLDNNVNSSFDENYPFVMNDGITLYFASANDKTSLGGYDLYVTRYNTETDTYLTPENLGMPFNSPYNDFMLVMDEVNQVGWFASDRYQPEDKVIIYLFIPNEEKLVLRNEDQDLIRNRAKITAIKDTQHPDDDFSALLNAINQSVDVSSEFSSSADFHFVVANNLIYTHIDDFKSQFAKDIFNKALYLKEEVNRLQEKLQKLRSEYASFPAKRDQLTTTILDLETELEKSRLQLEQYYLDARNEEVRFLMGK